MRAGRQSDQQPPHPAERALAVLPSRSFVVELEGVGDEVKELQLVGASAWMSHQCVALAIPAGPRVTILVKLLERVLPPRGLVAGIADQQRCH